MKLLGLDMTRSSMLTSFLAVLCALALVFFDSGCKAGPVRKHIAATQVQVQQAIELKGRLDDLLVKMQTGAVQGQAAIDLLVTMLPESYGVHVRTALSKGAQAMTVAAEVSQALGTTANALMDRLSSLGEELRDAEDSDDATRQVVSAILGGAASLLGVGGPLAPLLMRLGQRKGASAVAEVIHTGRTVDPSLNSSFNSGPGHDAMKALLDKLPGVVYDAVVRVKNQ